MGSKEYKSISTIKSWAEADRPREKMQQQGRAALSDAELIAILIGSGTTSLSALDVGKIILKDVSNNLNALAKYSIKDLTKFKGIGEAKAITIVAALEIGRRRKESSVEERPKVTSSFDAYRLLKPVLLDLPNEEFWVILLDRSNKLLKLKKISSGGVSGTVVDAKVIFKEAIDQLASSMILAHNHPSGNNQPSQADKQLTKKLKESGDILGIPVLDHVIFAEDKYFSFADEGML